MKICYIADASSMHTRRWVNYFSDRGHEIHLISTTKGDEYASSIHFHLLTAVMPKLPLISKYASALSQLIQVRGLVRQIQPDLLHAHYIAINGYLSVATGFHPLVLSAWGSDILIHPKHNPIWKALTRYTLNKAEYITCDANHMVEAIARFGVNQDKIKLVYFGTDVQRFKPEKRDDGLRKRLGLDNAPIVISLRNFAPIYDIDTLINAVPLILKEVPEVRFIIAGKGPEELKLKETAKSLGVSDKIIFPGLLSQEELPQYLASSEVYVSTSLSDAGLSASTAEAMASGLPVVITNFGDNSKWVKDGVNGFLFPLSNPEALASKITYLLRSRYDRMRFGQANRSVIEERNNYEREMEKVGKLYEQLIATQ